MTNRSNMEGGRPAADRSQRTAVRVSALRLLLMALLAPFAQFGVLQTLVVPAHAAATTTNLAGSVGLLRFEPAVGSTDRASAAAAS
jgi:hypothetical protein